jgi:sphinganine C4-monooxygenase
VIAQQSTGLNMRQTAFFFILINIKVINDHTGYDFPWDPFNLLCSNTALFHDIHHQTWGIKHNFSQPFLIFWDRYLGTEYLGDVSQMYKRSAENAKKAVEEDRNRAALEVENQH